MKKKELKIIEKDIACMIKTESPIKVHLVLLNPLAEFQVNGLTSRQVNK